MEFGHRFKLPLRPLAQSLVPKIIGFERDAGIHKHLAPLLEALDLIFAIALLLLLL
jgi:hypothetical protein